MLAETCISWLPGASWSSVGPGSCCRVLETWDRKIWGYFSTGFRKEAAESASAFLMLPGMPQCFSKPVPINTCVFRNQTQVQKTSCVILQSILDSW